MRIATSFTLASIFVVGGCSTFSATINQLAPSDAGTDAGDETGGQASTGGASTVGNASSTGGISSAGGGSTTGGASSTAGANASGGVSNATTGGANGSGGTNSTGGASTCSANADCVNPDPINCSYTCVNPGASGTCKPAALLGPTQCATSACDEKAISGFWDAQGKPHIAFGFTETDGTASIHMQQLKLDGSLDGTAVPYGLPTGQQEPSLLSANAQASKVAFLWFTAVTASAAGPDKVVDFAITDTNGVATSPAEVERDSYGTSNAPMLLSLQVTLAGAWLAAEDLWLCQWP